MKQQTRKCLPKKSQRVYLPLKVAPEHTIPSYRVYQRLIVWIKTALPMPCPPALPACMAPRWDQVLVEAVICAGPFPGVVEVAFLALLSFQVPLLAKVSKVPRLHPEP